MINNNDIVNGPIEAKLIFKVTNLCTSYSKRNLEIAEDYLNKLEEQVKASPIEKHLTIFNNSKKIFNELKKIKEETPSVMFHEKYDLKIDELRESLISLLDEVMLKKD